MYPRVTKPASWIASAVLAAFTSLGGCASTSPRTSPESCPVCGKPVADGPEVRVILPGQTGPGTRYRCFMCPIMEGATPEAWTLRAVSGVDGKWVTFHVRGDRVDSDPASAVVLALPVRAGEECLDLHRVFVDEEEFERYLAARPAMRGTRSTTLADVLKTHGK